MFKSRFTVLALTLAVAACSNDDPGEDPPLDDLLEPAPPPGGQQLTSLAYTVEPGAEKYFCYTFRSPPDAKGIVEVGNIPGSIVHHVALYKTRSPEPDGFQDCPVLVKLSWEPIWAGGVGAPGAQLPEGTAFKIEGDTQYLIQYHLQNTSDSPVTERSAINLTYADPAPLVTANLLAFGSFDLTIPARATGFTQDIECLATKQMHVFAAFPHMHKLGKKLEFSKGGDAATAERAYAIDPWRFGDQPFDTVDFTIEPGEYLRARCTWDNASAAPITFGESSDDEMCFFLLFYYPADNGPEACLL